MDLGFLTQTQVLWLTKYVRQSWRLLDDLTIAVEGNITIRDSQMTQLPVNFSTVTGTFKCSNCTSLVSNQGIPHTASECIFEDCAFPEHWYTNSIKEGRTLEEFVDVHFSSLLETHEPLLHQNFPTMIKKHRGTVKGKEFGF
jgi:hypothetical protein